MFEIVQENLFYQLAAILIMAAGLGFIALKLHQPLIVAFIALGLLAGPDALGLIGSETALIDTMAELGIALLLLMVGLKLDLNLIRTLGGVALATGLGQVTFTAFFGFLICLMFGMGVVPALYVAVALTFSSTIIIIKLLSDKREIDSLHGKIALGFLIVQDIFVVFCMVVLSAFGIGQGEGDLLFNLGGVFLKGIALLAFIYFFIVKVATPLMSMLTRSPELMTTFAVAWAATLAAVAAMMGFSIELGGLLAGVSLASTPFRDAIASRLFSLRDFLLLFFFIALGAHIDLHILGAQLVPALALSLFVLIGNPLIVMAIMGFMGYRKRTGFLAGLTVAQISEFSLIFMAMGITLGHVGEDMLGLVTLVGLVTISLSTYMITFSQTLYGWLEPYLDGFERKKAYRESENKIIRRTKKYDVVVLGAGRYGRELIESFLENGKTVLALDFDPRVVRRINEDPDKPKNLDAGYADITDPGFAEYLPIKNVSWVVCAVPGSTHDLYAHDFRVSLVESLRDIKYTGKVAAVSHSGSETTRLRAAGIDLVLTPFPDAACQAVSNILSYKG